jgi:hypothetical protein
VCPEIFPEGSRSACDLEIGTSRISMKSGTLNYRRRTDSFKFPADAGFVCGHVSVTAAVLRDTIKDAPYIKVQYGISHVETRVEYYKSVPLTSVPCLER